ncbi:MAG: ribokinase [Planktomarina sp.]
MTIFNLGSINADHFYAVPHIVKPGQTLASTKFTQGLGGKGANQSVAITRAGGAVRHIGAVGADGQMWLDRLAELGVAVDDIATLDTPTGHAIISVAADGENAITLFPGANQMIPAQHIEGVLADLGSNDWLLMQNETNGQDAAIAVAKAKGAKIAYSAAPFKTGAVKAILPHIDLLVVNEGEAEDTKKALGVSGPEDLPVSLVLMTLGSKGAVLIDTQTKSTIHAVTIPVTAIDTTGAGDTFLGYFMAATDLGMDAKAALTLANKAAALKVTKPGTADAIPGLDEVNKFQS